MSENRQPKSRTVACALAFAGMAVPGLHKFYLGQNGWGLLYLALSFTPISHVASVVEGCWFLIQGDKAFDQNFNSGTTPGTQITGTSAKREQAITTADAVASVAEALRHLDQLRQEGLMSEYEFEQKRRQLLDHI